MTAEIPSTSDMIIKVTKDCVRHALHMCERELFSGLKSIRKHITALRKVKPKLEISQIEGIRTSSLYSQILLTGDVLNYRNEVVGTFKHSLLLKSFGEDTLRIIFDSMNFYPPECERTELTPESILETYWGLSSTSKRTWTPDNVNRNFASLKAIEEVTEIDNEED
ncbi:hypothetical protein ACTXT7_017528 [Hymenolepis weldensis]